MFTDELRARSHVRPPSPAPGSADAALPAAPRSSPAATVLATLAIVGALWVGQRFLIPLAAGLLLSMLLAPLVGRTGRLLHSTALASVGALVLFVGVLGLAAGSFGGQLARVTERVPEMISLAAQRLTDTDASSPTVLTRARDALHELDRAASQWSDAKETAQAATGSTRLRSGTLTVRQSSATAAVAAAPAASGPTPISDGATVAFKQTAVSGSGVLLKFAADLTLILFIAFFVLAGGTPLLERFLDQWGPHPVARARTEQALLECVRQVRLYAGVLLVTNVMIGLVVWGAFTAGGLPDAAGWGVAAAVLHVVPYVGMALLTGLGAAESFLAHGTLGAAFGMAGALVLSSTVIGTLVSAWLQGRAAKMNAAAVFIGLVFWGALWGIWGLFLGPALVVVLKVAAEHSRSGQRLARLMQG
jgi:predicted PurR-regulated permease PerM